MLSFLGGIPYCACGHHEDEHVDEQFACLVLGCWCRAFVPDPECEKRGDEPA
ncbi:hypothetical protein K2Z84_21430 [Candidatus Binatia bacterium]|nr:hypothetical protein [Candidatus Binatia bacterium]